MIFLYNNLLDAAALTESSQASGFPVENIQHPFRTKVWRTAGGVAGTANVVIDHGVAVAISCAALINYSWTEAPGTLDLEFNAADAWGAPTATEALTWAANPTVNGNNGTIIKIFAAALTFRYNRLNVVYSPGAVPTDWDLGRMFVGSYFQPTHDRLYGDESGQDFVDLSDMLGTAGGQ